MLGLLATTTGAPVTTLILILLLPARTVQRFGQVHGTEAKGAAHVAPGVCANDHAHPA